MKSFCAFILFCAIAWFVALSSPRAGVQGVQDPLYWEPTEAELAAAHRHHGILYSYEGEDHKWYFVRDGKECNLFSYLKERLR